MTKYFGANTNNWPSATADSDHDGVSNLNEFLAGTNPTNAASVLQVQVANTPQGLFLYWNTQPGLIYQVQQTTNFSLVEQCGRAAVRGGHERFHLCRGRLGGLLPRPAPTLRKSMLRTIKRFWWLALLVAGVPVAWGYVADGTRRQRRRFVADTGHRFQSAAHH